MNEIVLSIWVLMYPVHYPETNTTLTSKLEYRSEEVCKKQQQHLGKGQCVPELVTLKINKQGGRKNVKSTILDTRRI